MLNNAQVSRRTDGKSASNVKAFSTAAYTYDKVNRLVSASFYDGPTGTGNLKQQSYTFDAYGNLTAIAGNNGRNIPASTTSNRLTGAVTYDAAGNLTSWNGAQYTYDHFNQMTHMVSGGEDWTYLYTADDERIWSYTAALSRWTLRDLDGKVLREYLADARGWSAANDYLYRDGLLLAAETQTGRRNLRIRHQEMTPKKTRKDRSKSKAPADLVEIALSRRDRAHRRDRSRGRGPPSADRESGPGGVRRLRPASLRPSQEDQEVARAVVPHGESPRVRAVSPPRGVSSSAWHWE